MATWITWNEETIVSDISYIKEWEGDNPLIWLPTVLTWELDFPWFSYKMETGIDWVEEVL